MKERFSQTHILIFGNGLPPQAYPGVDRTNWRYNPDINNYDYIGKEVNPVSQIISKKVPVLVPITHIITPAKEPTRKDNSKDLVGVR